MPTHTPLDPHYAERIRASFARQGAMDTLGAELTAIAPGEVVIEFDHQPALTQQHGYIHAGMLTTVVDNACGYAACSLMPADRDVLTIEFKVNFVAPAKAPRYRAVGSVVRAGRRVSVCRGDVIALSEDGEQLIATMLATLISATP